PHTCISCQMFSKHGSFKEGGRSERRRGYKKWSGTYTMVDFCEKGSNHEQTKQAGTNAGSSQKPCAGEYSAARSNYDSCSRLEHFQLVHHRSSGRAYGLAAAKQSDQI